MGDSRPEVVYDLKYVFDRSWRCRMVFTAWDGKRQVGRLTILQSSPDTVRVTAEGPGQSVVAEFDRLSVSIWLRTPDSDPLTSGQVTWNRRLSIVAVVIAQRSYVIPRSTHRDLRLAATR